MQTLIISDDAGLAGDLRRRLTNIGHQVAATVAAAADAFAPDGGVPRLEEAPDVVVLDLPALPADGEARALQLVREHCRAPIVAVIAAADEARWLRSRGDDPVAHVVRPVTDRELRGAVELAVCRHEMMKAVRATEDRFFATSVDLLCFLDFSGYFRRLNPSWERALGFTTEELMARRFIEFVHPDDRERTLAQNALVRGGGQAVEFENRYLCRDGSYRWLRWNAASDPAAGVIYSVARDVTAQRHAEAERDQMLVELRTALAEVNELRRFLPICSYCRKVRDDENYWHTVEAYIAHHTSTRFSHGVCPSCMETEVEPQFAALERGRGTTAE